MKEIALATGKSMRLQLIGTFKPCKAYALGKAKKGTVSKISVPCSMVKGKRLFIDISFQSLASMGGKKHLFLMVEDSTKYLSSYFLKQKSELNEVKMILLKHLRAVYDVTVKYIHCGNAGENEAFEWLCKQ